MRVPRLAGKFRRALYAIFRIDKIVIRTGALVHYALTPYDLDHAVSFLLAIEGDRAYIEWPGWVNFAPFL